MAAPESEISVDSVRQQREQAVRSVLILAYNDARRRQEGRHRNPNQGIDNLFDPLIKQAPERVGSEPNGDVFRPPNKAQLTTARDTLRGVVTTSRPDFAQFQTEIVNPLLGCDPTALHYAVDDTFGHLRESDAHRSIHADIGLALAHTGDAAQTTTAFMEQRQRDAVSAAPGLPGTLRAQTIASIPSPSGTTGTQVSTTPRVGGEGGK